MDALSDLPGFGCDSGAISFVAETINVPSRPLCSSSDFVECADLPEGLADGATVAVLLVDPVHSTAMSVCRVPHKLRVLFRVRRGRGLFSPAKLNIILPSEDCQIPLIAHASEYVHTVPSLMKFLFGLGDLVYVSKIVHSPFRFFGRTVRNLDKLLRRINFLEKLHPIS